MKAAVYIRVSTDEQTEYSPKSQQEMIARYAQTHAIELSEAYTYIDEGISGRTSARPAFQKMLADARIKPKPFDLVLVWKFSRFARNRKDSIVCKAMLKQQGIEVVSVSEPLGDDSTSVLMEALLEAMDEYYSLNLAQEVRRGMEQKFREGGVVSRPPFGYRMREGEFVIEPTEADAVKQLFEGISAGRSLRSLADTLAAEAICRADGSLLTPRAIRYILQNPIYCGRAGRTIEGKWVVLPARQPPIVSEQIFDGVQSIFARSASDRRKGSQKHRSRDWMLRGLLVCSNCGAKIAKAGKGYLQCSGYARGSCKVSHFVRENKVNSALAASLKRLDSSAVVLTFEERERRQNREAELFERALQRAERAYLAGFTDLTEYMSQKERVIAQKEAFSEVTLSSVSVNTAFIAAFIEDDRFSPIQKHDLLCVLIEQIVFESRTGTLRIKLRAQNGSES